MPELFREVLLPIIKEALSHCERVPVKAMEADC